MLQYLYQLVVRLPFISEQVCCSRSCLLCVKTMLLEWWEGTTGSSLLRNSAGERCNYLILLCRCIIASRLTFVTLLIQNCRLLLPFTVEIMWHLFCHPWVPLEQEHDSQWWASNLSDTHLWMGVSYPIHAWWYAHQLESSSSATREGETSLVSMTF